MAGHLTALIMAALLFWSSHLVSRRLVGREGGGARLTGLVVVAAWLSSFVFVVLMNAGVFHLGAALLVWLGLAVLLTWRLDADRTAWTQLKADGLASVSFVTRRRSRFHLAVLGLAALWASLYFIRALVMPPLAWDALSYHLVKAGRWVQEAGFRHFTGPDQWGFYNHFPPLGDAPRAWAMLPSHDDSLLAFVDAFSWAAILPAGYFAARSLGAKSSNALLAAITIALLPGIFHYMTSSYVEPLVLALFLSGAGFFARFMADGADGHALLTAGAFGVLAGIKWNFAPVVVGFTGLLSLVALLSPRSWRRRGALIVGVAVAGTVALPHYVKAWIETGSPFYPLRVQFLGRELHPGNDELVLYMTGQISETGESFSPLTMARTLVDPTFPGVGHMGFGLMGPALVVAGLVSAVLMVRRRTHTVPVLVLIGVAAYVVVTLLSSDYYGIWALGTLQLGRFWAPAVAVCVVLVACLPGRWGDGLLAVAAISYLLLGVPRGFSPLDVAPVALMTLSGAVAAALAASAFRRTRGAGPSTTTVLAGLFAVVLFSAALTTLRTRYRYVYYEGTESRLSFSVRPLNRDYTSAWRIWRALDTPASPRRLAVSAGWANGRWNWFLYPLLGSRLQNALVYVPITSDGEVIDYRLAAEVEARKDFTSWLRRLVEEEIDYVVALAPAPPELAWLRAHPEIFRDAISAPRGGSEAYRVDRAMAERWLERAQSGTGDG